MPGEITATAPNTATKAKPYVCTTCTRPFARLEHLKRHERSHTKEKPFCCEQAGELPGCGRRFARRDLLLRHQQKIHLFPNTSKRRRMSSSATSNSTASSASKTTPPAEDLRLQYTMTMPNLDDMNNYTNGTVNPSSIFGSSPPASARSSRDSPSFSESSLPYNMSQADFTWATERLLPVDLMGASQPDSVYSQQWQMPELTTLSSPGSSISSGSWSPQYDQSFMLNQPSALDMSGMPVENELYTQDFFVNNTTYQTPQRTSGNLTLQQIQAQFMQSQQMDYANTKTMVMNEPSYITDASLRMQFAPDMNYGFIPEQMAYGSYVETY